MRPEIKAAVREIRADRQRGARQLALVALEVLRDVAPDCSGEELRDCARGLALARPMTAAIENAMAWAWSRYLETGDSENALGEAIEAIQVAPEGMAMAAHKVISSRTLMTYSYSTTVIELFQRLHPMRVITSEARPFNEGLKLARELVSSRISITYITDPQVGLLVQEADGVVVGADTILPDGSFTNKIGTKLLALAAKEEDVPFYVASETLKVAAPSQPLPFAPEEGDPKEVCGEKWLEVRNVYYEMVPARLVTAYVTEEGLIDPAGIGRYATEAERRWQTLVNSHEA